MNHKQNTSASFFSLLVILLICCAYSNTFSSPLVLDDFHTFVFEEKVYLKDLSLSSLFSPAQTFFGLQRWLPMLSFSLDLWFGGGEIFNLHLTNLLIHLLCGLAVFLLIYNLFLASREGGHALAVSPLFFAVWVAGLWALNPVQTNAVTYVVQRMASIQALFFTASCAFYVLGRRIHRRHSRVGKALPCYLACLVAAVGAFLSKENSAMLPVMLLATEIWFFSPGLHRSLWKRLRTASWVSWGVLLAGLLIALLFSLRLFQQMAAGYSIRHFTLMERLLTEARVVVWYLSLLLWPVPSRLALEHDVVVSSSLFNPPTTLPAVAMLGVLGWLTLRYGKRYPLITYGGAWFFLNLAIESTIVPLELAFEHRLYLPSVGVALAAVCLLVAASSRLLANHTSREVEIVRSCIFALLFSAMTLLTFYRNEAWQDRITIYQDVVEKAPNHPRGHANLAVAYGRAGLYEESIRQAEMSIALGQEHHEQYFVAANTILASLTGMKRFEEVVKRGEEFLENRPERFDAGSLTNFHLNLAQAHLKLGNLPQAYAVAMQAFKSVRLTGGSLYEMRLVEGMLVGVLKAAAETQVDLDQDGVDDPGSFSVEFWAAKRLLKEGERGEATNLLTLATEANPADKEAAGLLAEIKREDALNDAQMRKENMKERYQSSPFSRFNACMALAYWARTPNQSTSLRNLGEKLLDYALEIQPDVPDAHLLRANYLHDRGEIEPAVRATQRALALDPGYARAWLGLGYFLMELNDFPAAVKAFEKGLELYPGCPQRQSVLAVITAIKQTPALGTTQD